jgi:gliding motility-associated-like protein
MKAKPQSLKIHRKVLAFLVLSAIYGFTSLHAQCPTVTNPFQSLCNVESVLVGDLQAIDNGGGIVWYESATSTVPLSNTQSLISGEDYYADDTAGSCTTRARVDVIIFGPPVGSNFQGICLDDPTLATVADLDATGNDVQWYLTPTGGLPLDPTTILIDEAIYYADQANPDTGCRTSRLAVSVIVGATPVPVGDPIQEFCVATGDVPTVGDLVASGNNNWYISLFSALALPESTPLINGQIYYATTVDLPCESSGRLGVVAILDSGPDSGSNGVLELCDNDTNSPIDLFTILGGTPDSGGTWSPPLNSGTGVFNPNIDPDGVYTYTVSSSSVCPDESSTVTVTTFEGPDAGTNGSLVICSNNGTIDLFSSLGGTPDTGGTWTPALNSTTGIFNPLIDPPGIYTYTVSGVAPCSAVSATVQVSVSQFNNAGEDGSIEICDSIGVIDLFNSLEGTPDTGGTWSPILNSGTGVFDPTIDPQGTYTYSFPGDSVCPPSSATVTVIVNQLPDAGQDASIELCSNETNLLDLFNILGGSPDAGGVWSPNLTSGTGVFDPQQDAAGIYTYTLAGTSPCPDVSATVEVIIIEEPNAGISSTIDICDNNGTINLFESLGGTPDTGGTWSPALNSGTNIFDPLIDGEGTYTYTVTGTTPCADASASVTISVTPFLDAGLNGTLTICINEEPVDLFDSLGGTPDAGGTWSPLLTSGTGIFDPAVDPQGTYTYTTSAGNACANDSATVVVTVEPLPDAGTNGTLTICNISGTVDLFDSLGGTPETGGIWSPALTSTTGIFDPNIDAEGVYTYSLTAPCGTSSATVTVSIDESIDAGSDGSIELCTTDAQVNLFDSLGGTPEAGGIWTPALTSGSGVFDPSIDPAGLYTYTISNSASLCPETSASVLVTVFPEPNAGTNGTLNLCNDANPVNLFDSLGGTPDTGGIWSPALTSGSGILDPNSDPEGTYTYTVTSFCGTSTATVTVSYTNLNDAGVDGSIQLCANDASVDLFDSLGGTPDIGGTWTPPLNSGTGVFNPLTDAPGVYTYTVSSITSLCPSEFSTVTVSVLPEPDAGTNGTLNLCNATNTFDLFDSLGGTPQTGGIWTPSLSSGTGIFDPNTDPEGVYSYTINTLCGNSSATVTVSFSELNDAGIDSAVTLCIDDTPIDLFNILGGIPQPGGVWSPELNSGSGIYDPSIDPAGNYTYTISNSASLCPEASATVSVSLLQEPIAGENGILNLCDATSSVNLFDSLGGTPETGGTWSPILSSGTGIFDPNTDSEGVYTYTISNACGTSSATVTVSLSLINDAGINGILELCSDDSSPVDLFNSLGGTPDIGGTWSPTLASGTGVFDPTLDTAGTYTYTVGDSSSTCPPASSTVTVTILSLPDAGTDSTLDLCSNEAELINLLDILNGTPDSNGTWSPALNSGTSIFDPSVDPGGIYTYTVNSSCGSASATLTITIIEANDAGNNGVLELCSDETASVDLFDSLGGTPQIGGTWSPALNSGTGVFDPNLDATGTYTYTVTNSTSICPEASATVTVSILPEPNAGINSTLNLCIDQTDTVDLFDSLDGSPDTGGTWSPALNSGTNIFDPTIDAPGVYTYTVNSVECNLTSVADLTVVINDIPDASGLTLVLDEGICIGRDAIISVTGATMLSDGDYTIVYELSEANTSTNTTTITVIDGNSSFVISADLLTNPGTTFITLTQLFFVSEFCSAPTELIEPLKIFVIDAPTPQIIDNGSEFCERDNPTIENLTNNIIDSELITWYDQPENGTAFNGSELLEDDRTYYAALQTDEGCESDIRLAVTVSLIECFDDIIIPDGFSPNGDSVNDVFDILYIEELYPNYKLFIYNRYGNTLYEGNINSPKWDGTSKDNNTILPVGVYFYIIEFNDGEREPVQGRVYLSR